MSEVAKPLPSPTEATRPFWSAAAEGKLKLKRCTACGRHHAPTRAACVCGSTDFAWAEVSGHGTVFSFTVVHRAPDPAFRGEVPYVIAVVEFAEGARLMANLGGVAPADVKIGMAVKTVFHTAAEGVGVPRFEPR